MVSLTQTLRRSLPLSLAAALSLAQPLHADQTDRIDFDVVLKGITAGRLTIDGKIEGNSYGANGVMKTAGLVGALKTIRYDARVSGGYVDGVFTPLQFAETALRSGNTVEHGIVYKNGKPVSVTRNPPRTPRDRDVAPDQQGGTIDPLTALYAVLRDVPREEACKLKVTMYDGARRSQVALAAPQSAGEGVKCAGEYRRLEGFSEKDMAEKTRFPFVLTYAPTGDGRLRVVEISTDTIYGKGRLKRR